MFYRTFLIKYGEIGVKGKNRSSFEDALVKQVKIALSRVDGEFHVWKEQGRIIADVLGEEGSCDYDEIIRELQTVFGIVGICPVVKAPLGTPEEIAPAVIDFLAKTYGLKIDENWRQKHGEDTDGTDGGLTFKVHSRRANKQYPVASMDVNAYLGEKILDAFPGQVKVDVHDPKLMLYVELRDEVFIYSRIIPGPGGMPLGTNGSAMLCLSGGIDSPVAGWMIAKRGVAIDAAYFHAPPYTSERAKQKVVDLAKIISRYTGPIRLHIVNFTDIQLAIYDKCPHDELTIIMRRYMMRIAEIFAKEDGCQGLITGESLGQVASQTMQSLVCTDEVCTMPVFRPLIGFDKQDIVDLSLKIGTYDTSIEPYEDCCTIFVAKHPVTKPRLDVIKRSETKLADVIDDLIKKAVSGAAVVEVGKPEKG